MKLTGPLSRRNFLGGAGGIVGVALAGTSLSGRAQARPSSPTRDRMVTIFLRGGMDGLTTCVPYGDGDLYVARPTIAVAPPGQTNGAVDLDGFFGLAPAAAPLLTPYGNGHLAIVHATGSTDPTRSHFDAFTRMEFGIPNQPLNTASSGWLARHLQSLGPAVPGTPLRGVALTGVAPKTLAGAPQTLPIRDLGSFAFPGDPLTAAARQDRMSTMYDDEAPPVGPAALDSFASIAYLGQIDFAGYLPGGGAIYPATGFGQAMMQTAALLKHGDEVEAVMLELGHWDLHNALGPIDGDMAANLDELARSLEAFYLDMGSDLDDVVVVVMSEFGRRVAQNGSLGLDHGHGNCMLLMGGHIDGGKVHGTWPGLAPQNLDNGDLAITTDYRDVLGEILELRMQSPDLGLVFPGHTPNFPGVVI